MEQQYLYWYHLDTHTNPLTEGYIGITSNIAKRHSSHMVSKKITHFTNAIKKYKVENILLDILHIVNTREKVGVLEEYYRPSKDIGWNMMPGGEEPLTKATTQISIYHINSYPILHTFKSIKEATAFIKGTRGRLSKALHNGVKSYGRDGWAILHTHTYDRSTTKTYNEMVSIALKGTKKTKPSHFKGVTNRWTDAEKQRISRQHKGKIISEEQKAIVCKKNRASHTSCKQIQLKH